LYQGPSAREEVKPVVARLVVFGAAVGSLALLAGAVILVLRLAQPTEYPVDLSRAPDGEIVGRVAKIEPGAILLSSEPAGSGVVPLVVTKDARVMVGTIEGWMADVRPGGQIKVAYDLYEGKRLARSVEVLPEPGARRVAPVEAPAKAAAAGATTKPEPPAKLTPAPLPQPEAPAPRQKAEPPQVALPKAMTPMPTPTPEAPAARPKAGPPRVAQPKATTPPPTGPAPPTPVVPAPARQAPTLAPPPAVMTPPQAPAAPTPAAPAAAPPRPEPPARAQEPVQPQEPDSTDGSAAVDWFLKGPR